MCGKSAYCWNTMFTGRRFEKTVVTSSPWSRMRPSSGTSKPAIIRSVVVLPQPLGPSSEKNSPSRIARLTSLTAAALPKRLLTPSSSIATRSSGMPGESIPLEIRTYVRFHLRGAARARLARPARGHARGARAVDGGRGGALAVRHLLHLTGACLLAARGRDGRGQPARLHRRDGLADRRPGGPAARRGRVRRLRPRDDRPLGDPESHLRVRRGARAGARARGHLPVARQPGGRPPRSRRPPDRPGRVAA